MPTGKAGVTINSSLLNSLITNLGTKVGFARKHNFRQRDIINWTLGLTRPSKGQIQKLCKALEITPEMILLPGEIHAGRGWQTGLSRWAQGHIDNTGPPLTNNEAIRLIELTTPDTLEKATDEGTESPFFVQGPSESHNTTE